MPNNSRLNDQLISIEDMLKTDPSEALATTERLLTKFPNVDSIQLLIARCLRTLGKNIDAKIILNKLINNSSSSVIANMELATILFNESNFIEALDILKKTTQRYPEHHEVWEILSQHLYRAGDTQGAKSALEQFTMIREFNVQLANATEHFKEGRYEESDELCRKLLKQIPTEVRVLQLLAKISTQFEHYDVSESLLEYCILQKNDDIDLGIDYANTLLNVKKYNLAKNECERLIRFSKDYIKILPILAECQIKLGYYELAIESYRKLVDIHPQKDRCLVRYGNALKITGKTVDAIESYKKAISISPNMGEAYWSLANLKTYSFSELDIETMRSTINSGKLNTEDFTMFNFTLGKALEDNNQFTESFSCYKKGNDARLKSNYQINTEEISKIHSQYSKENLKTNSQLGNQSKDPIFIVGLRRSGSTLLEQILASHSRVDGTSELQGISVISQQLKQVKNNPASNSNKIDFSLLGQQYLDDCLSHRKNAEFFTDKQPNNFKHIGLIKSILPNAKIIDIRRDPMACGWSLYKQYFADGVEYSYDLELIGKYYQYYVKTMDYWHSVLPNQILSIQYEDLINDFEVTVSKILDYCGLEFESSCLNFHKTNRAIATISSEQVKQPIYKGGLSHWKKYESSLDTLKAALEAALED